MANASATFSNLLLKHYFNNDDHAGIGDVSGLQNSAAVGSFYIRLCTDASVPDASTIGTECAYTGYVAKGIAVARNTGALPVTANQFKNGAELLFGACTAGTENARYAELWVDNTSTTEAARVAFVQLTADLPISAGTTPKIAANALVFTFL